MRPLVIGSSRSCNPPRQRFHEDIVAGAGVARCHADIKLARGGCDRIGTLDRQRLPGGSGLRPNANAVEERASHVVRGGENGVDTGGAAVRALARSADEIVTGPQTDERRDLDPPGARIGSRRVDAIVYPS